MVARGDLGVEVPYEEVPIIQKALVRAALDRGVPTIVATQMLESMTAAARPTRAEASDVANAIFDGADAIMLSAETAVGSYPVLAAEAATRIARTCAELGVRHLPDGAPPSVATDAEALAYAAVALTQEDPDVVAVACYTRTGRTARLLASLRPRVPILAYCPEPGVANRLALVHGVEPRTCSVPDPTQTRLELMTGLVRDEGALPAGAALVLVASTAAPGTGPNSSRCSGSSRAFPRRTSPAWRRARWLEARSEAQRQEHARLQRIERAREERSGLPPPRAATGEPVAGQRPARRAPSCERDRHAPLDQRSPELEVRERRVARAGGRHHDGSRVVGHRRRRIVEGHRDDRDRERGMFGHSWEARGRAPAGDVDARIGDGAERPGIGAAERGVGVGVGLAHVVRAVDLAGHRHDHALAHHLWRRRHRDGVAKVLGAVVCLLRR